MVVPKINSAHGSETRNIINRVIDLLNAQGKTIQDLVAEGQLTPAQYATLIQTVNGLISKGNVAFDDIDINKGKLLPKHLSEEVLKMVTGDAPVNAVPADGSLTTRKYADKSVTQDKTDFVTTGKNLFDKTKITPSKVLNPTNGVLADSENNDVTDYIRISPSKNYTRSHRLNGAFYDEDKVFVSGLPGVSPSDRPETFTTPVNARYVRLSFRKSDVDVFQLETGAELTAYEPFEYIIKGLKTEFDDNSINGSKILSRTITEDKLDFEVPELEYTTNLLNKDNLVSGEYVNQTNGAFETSATYARTEYIPFSENERISFPHFSGNRIAFYDVNKSYVDGHLEPSSPVVSPDSEGYFVFSFRSSQTDLFQINKSETLLPYEPYGYRLKNMIGQNNEETEELIINLSDKIYAVVGEEMNLYFDNVISGKDTDYNFDIDFGGKGQQFEDFFRFVPDVKETKQLIFQVSKNNQVVAQKTSDVIVSDKTDGSGTTRSVVIIGDSTTNNGITVTKLNENFENDSMNITTLGTRGNAPNKHEGRSGWTASNYVTTEETASGVTNAFYNPSTSEFDFSYYLSSNSIARPNYVIINLGINDMFGLSSDAAMESKISEAITDYETMIDSIKENSSTIKIGLALTIPPNYSQDAFAKDYKTGQTRWRYKRNNILWVQRMIEHFIGKESQNIYLIPTNSVIDTKYNYGFVEEKVNARSEITRQVSASNGGVHPTTSGYWQIADAYWFWLKSFES